MKILTPGSKTSDQWLIFGIGNPGNDYENSYHNAGILALPAIIEALTNEPMDALDWKRHKKLFAYAVSGHGIFARSLAFMNESGGAAAEAVKKFGVPPERLVVAHDDSDILQGFFKISFDRSSGGHHGAQSIIDHLKTQAFWRVRIGIRPASVKAVDRQPAREAKRKKAGDFVLAEITPSAKKKLEIAFRAASVKLTQKVVGRM